MHDPIFDDPAFRRDHAVTPSSPAVGGDARYATPRARVTDIAPKTGATQPVNLFSPKGRIGRLRYLCWTIVFSVVIVLAGAFLKSVLGASNLFLVVFIVITYVMLALLSIQRSHDMDWSGWSILAFPVAIIAGMLMMTGCAILSGIKINESTAGNITEFIISITYFVWAFKPGTPGPNRFGAPSPPTPLGVKIGAMAFSVLMVIGIVANGAIPAYQAYVHRTHSASTPR